MPTTNKTFDTESYEETLIVENSYKSKPAWGDRNPGWLWLALRGCLFSTAFLDGFCLLFSFDSSRVSEWPTLRIRALPADPVIVRSCVPWIVDSRFMSSPMPKPLVIVTLFVKSIPVSNWIETALVMSPPILLALALSCVNKFPRFSFAPLAVVEWYYASIFEFEYSISRRSWYIAGECRSTLNRIATRCLRAKWLWKWTDKWYAMNSKGRNKRYYPCDDRSDCSCRAE